jgi:hypothetical protein
MGLHGNRYPGRDARFHFLVTATEHIRVTALEPHHELARLDTLDQRDIDRLLRHRAAIGDLRGVDHLDVGTEFGKQFRWRQPIGDHEGRPCQQPAAAHRDEIRIAWTAADQRDAGGDRCRIIGHHTGLQRLEQRIAYRRRTPVLPTRQHTEGEAVVASSRRGHRGTESSHVGTDTEDPPPSGLLDHGRIGLGLVGAGDRVPGAIEITVRVRAQSQGELSRGGHTLHRRSDFTADHMDVRTRGDQQAEPALRHRPTTDHDDAAPIQIEPNQVVRVARRLVIGEI